MRRIPTRHLMMMMIARVATTVAFVCLLQLHCSRAGFLLPLTPSPPSQVELAAAENAGSEAKLDESNIKLTSAMLAEETRKLSNNLQDPISHDKRLFVVELLKMLHEQWAVQKSSNLQKDTNNNQQVANKKQDSVSNRQLGQLSQLLGAIGADGDLRRLTDWVQNSFNLASVGELTTQFVVSKLGSVNCAALLQPDKAETLVPRFLLFNEHFTDVPFELGLELKSQDCLHYAKFDPKRKTILLVHGYLSGYTLVDGLTNIKNRLLDLNKLVNERALRVFQEAERNNGSYLLTDDLEQKVRLQQYNVIIVDWFQGANPVPRSRYIRAAVNAQVVGELIANFLFQLINQCRAKAPLIEIMAHSLGCHVAGFTGKSMLARGQRLGKITHLDPVGLCFGRLFSQPKYRLSPQDALETQAVHVSLNLFDNPLDGAQTNFLVNGGRDQLGCQSQSELRNSTTSSVSLLYDRDARFSPCSHVRALSLYEDDLASEPQQCQIVGYRCTSYDRFLAGKCAKCDSLGDGVQEGCRLMSLTPIMAQPFRKLSMNSYSNYYTTSNQQKINHPDISLNYNKEEPLLNLVSHYKNGSIAWLVDDQELNQKIGKAIVAKVGRNIAQTKLYEDTNTKRAIMSHNELAAAGRRSDRRLHGVMGDSLVAQTLDKIKQETVQALTGGWTSLRSAEYKLSTIFNPQILKEPLSLEPASEVELPMVTLTAELGHQNQNEVPSTAPSDPMPVGGQPLPAGSVNQPLYFVGTGVVSPYCVNYYQFRLLIAESRIRRMVQANTAQGGQSLGQINTQQEDSSGRGRGDQRLAAVNRDMLHMTVKLVDSSGRFFKGFTLQESARSLVRLLPSNGNSNGKGGGQNGPRPTTPAEPMVEVTMLLNTTRLEPVKISETVISYYFHGIVLADSVEVNYMSNISPEVRARYSSMLCPMAINDKHQLVRYIECNKIEGAKR